MSAPIVIKNPYVTIDGTDVSSEVQSVSITYEAAEVDATAGNADAVTEKTTGLKSFSFDVTVRQDFATIDALLFDLVGADAFEVVIKPRAVAVSADNPSYTGDCILTSYTPLSGNVGDLATTQVQLPGTGVLARAIA